MTSGLARPGRWIDAVEGLTLVQVGQPSGRWGWFQIIWAGLHATAVMMHVLSVLYHARRVVSTKDSESLFTAGCPGRHLPSPVSLAERRTDEARSAAS